jgi:protein-S-isoprenylcysteine O-methyltransferase Ste14
MRRSSINPWVLPTSDDAHGFLGRSFYWIVGVYVFILLAWALVPDWSVRVFGALPLLMRPVPAWTGVGFLTLGTTLVVIAQRAMGMAWRVGIPKEDKPMLITDGPLRFSRNPVFLGMLLAAGGIALAIPHVLSWATLSAVYVALSVQVRLEEAYLEGWLGPSFTNYTTQVARWVNFGKQGP